MCSLSVTVGIVSPEGICVKSLGVFMRTVGILAGDLWGFCDAGGA